MAASRIRVLIADDEAHIRKVIGGIVGALGAEVVAEAGDGAQAVELFEQVRPDMVFLDINMPGLTGDRALERMLAIEPRLVGIMMTAQDSIETVRNCLGIGARHYILKSNPAEEIYRLVKECWPGFVGEIAGARH